MVLKLGNNPYTIYQKILILVTKLTKIGANRIFGLFWSLQIRISVIKNSGFGETSEFVKGNALLKLRLLAILIFQLQTSITWQCN